jgi:hypothetical protein
MLRMCVYMHSRFVENHPIRILEDGSLISEVVLSHHEDRLTLDALLASVPSEMVASLADKPTGKDAWDSITATHVGLDCAQKATMQN